MSLLAVGVSHQTAPVALLEQFAMGADATGVVIRDLPLTPERVWTALQQATTP